MRRLANLLLASILLLAPAHAEQDLLLGADMGSAAMTRAEMTRTDVEAMIARADGKPIDLS
jgi:hypothetical protein